MFSTQSRRCDNRERRLKCENSAASMRNRNCRSPFSVYSSTDIKLICIVVLSNKLGLELKQDSSTLAVAPSFIISALFVAVIDSDGNGKEALGT